jgi:Mrp family chromosome partitioning ATPase
MKEEGAGSACPAGGSPDAEIKARLGQRMSRIRHKLVVLSGKGGVGKSTVAVNLAVALGQAKKRVGLLDVDLHGPSVPKMLGLEGRTLQGGAHGIEPVPFSKHVRVVSIGFLLASENDAVIWRGPRKFGMIRQFLAEVDWGELDYLVVDSPPGTGDEPLAICELLGGGSPGACGCAPSARRGAVIVTTPQQVSVADVRRCIEFCRQVHMPIHGLVENMSYLSCPDCGKTIHVFGSGGGEEMALEAHVPLLGQIPLEPEVVRAGDNGRPLALHPQLEGPAIEQCATARAFLDISRKIVQQVEEEASPTPQAGSCELGAPALAEGSSTGCG